jgi:hypothetical protein
MSDPSVTTKTTTVLVVEKFRDHPAPCRYCGQIYEHHQRHIDPDHHQCCGGVQSPLVRCPACGCPANAPMNPMETGR